MVPGQTSHITTKYSADSRNRTPGAMVHISTSILHIQKPRTQEGIKNKIEKFHKLFNVYNTIHNILWRYGRCDGSVTAATKKPIALACQCGFSEGGKKRTVRQATFERERSELRENRAYDCGCNSGSSLRVAVGFLRKITHPPLEQYIT